MRSCVSSRRASAMSSGCGSFAVKASASIATKSASARVFSSPSLGICFSIGLIL